MKKTIALFLALAMAVSLITPAFADTGEPGSVAMNVRVAESSHAELPIEYTFSLLNAKKVMNATVRFEVDGTMLEGGALTFLTAGFSAMDSGTGEISWTRKDGDTWQGELLVMYLGGPDGFTAALETDIFKLSSRARQLGVATLRVTDIRIAGFNEAGEPVFLDGEIGGEATTVIALPAAMYSIYDLNRDGVIDERDLAMAQRYYLVGVQDATWAAAQACDFNGDKIVNMLDLIDLFRNFGIAVPPDVPPGVIAMDTLSAMELAPNGSGSFPVAATASNGQAVQITVRSDDTDVATVAINGAAVTVTAVAIGTATISVTASAPNCLDVVRRFAVTVSESGSGEDFVLAAGGITAALYVDEDGDTAVKRAVGDLSSDIHRVTGLTPATVHDAEQLGENAVIIGVMGQSALIDRLIDEGKLDVADVAGQWEAFVSQVVLSPLPGVEKALVIAGSDRRGAIFGVYDLSEQIGVSPWYWWADVTPVHRDTLIIPKGPNKQSPSVQYRGIFLNDEACLAEWANATFEPGKYIGPETYKKIFELLLRLKANFLWPAMWSISDSFNTYPETARIAAEDYGVVVGSTHCCMMLRANMDEWGPFAVREGLAPVATPSSNSAAEVAAYDYTVNPEKVYQYWEESVIAHATYESGWSVGMRGIHDTPLVTKNATTTAEKIAVLDRIVTDQRKMLAEHVNENVEEVLQLFTPYNEVLDLYNAGYKDLIPDDVTIIFPNDSHGYIRQLPDEEEQQRSGGAGIYYHFHYNDIANPYDWLCSQPPALIREEMYKAYANNARKLWVVNVGDIKPAEIAIDFLMTMAWDIDRYTEDNVDQFLIDWAAREFGDAADSEEIASILDGYYRLAHARRPEHERVGLFTITDYGDEGLKRVAGFEALVNRAQDIYDSLDESKRDAFYELVLYPVRGAYLKSRETYYAARNGIAEEQNWQSAIYTTALLAREARDTIVSDGEYFGQTLAGGKWNKIMDPYYPTNNLKTPLVLNLTPIDEAGLALLVEGTTPGAENPALNFSVYTQDNRFIDLFNTGGGSFDWAASADKPWILFDKRSGTVADENRVWVSIDWANIPDGDSTGTIAVASEAGTETVTVNISHPASPKRGEVTGYIEANGYVSIEAEHYTKLTAGKDADGETAAWGVMKNVGRDSDVVYSYPITAARFAPTAVGDIKENASVLAYQIYFFSEGTFPVTVYRLPTQDVDNGVHYAIAMDDGTPVVVTGGGNSHDHIDRRTTNLTVSGAGYHTLKIWMVDPCIAIDKIVVNTGGVRPSYFGPPESYHPVFNPNPSSITPALARPEQEPIEPKPWDWLGGGAFIEKDGEVAIEAETAVENSIYANLIHGGHTVSGVTTERHWTLKGGDSMYSLQCLPDIGNTGVWTQTTAAALDAAGAPKLQYWMDISTIGVYHVWVLSRAPDGNSDSVNWGIDGVYKGQVTTGSDSSFNWARLGSIAIIDPGFHSLQLWAREDGWAVDKIYLTLSGETPADIGPEKSQRGEDTGETPVVVTPDTISRGKPVTASAVQLGGINVASRAVDGDYATYWSSGSTTGWLKIDLEALCDIDIVNISWYDPGGRTQRYHIWVSTEETDDWVSATNTGSYTKAIDMSDNQIRGFGLHMLDESIQARYLVLEITSATATSAVYEVDLYGEPVESP